MKTRSILLLTLVLVLAAGAAYKFAGGPGEDPAAKKPAPAVPVTVASAVARDTPVLLEVVGRGEAYESVTLKARVDGQVIDMPFREGQRVAGGDVLVRLDPADFQARVAQAEANLARDQALLKKARADVERAQALKAQGFVFRRRDRGQARAPGRGGETERYRAGHAEPHPALVRELRRGGEAHRRRARRPRCGATARARAGAGRNRGGLRGRTAFRRPGGGLLDTLRAAVSVPAEAVQQGPEGPFVFVVTGEETTMRRVEVGPVREGFAVIARGMEIGETVVTDGHSRLVPGGKVKIKAPGEKPNAAPSGKSAKQG